MEKIEVQNYTTIKNIKEVTNEKRIYTLRTSFRVKTTWI
jgi:hypothetical protein